MNKKLFGRDDRQRRLAELYQAAEEGAEVPVADRVLWSTLAADQQLVRQLGGLAARSGPVNPAIGRAMLLSEVARKKSQAPEKGQNTMIGKLLTSRGLALLATAGIFAGGAVTVGASGGVSGAAGNVNDVLAALHVTDHTPDQADSHIDNIEQPDGSGKPDDSGTPAAERTPPAVAGIPTDNAQHQAADGDGVCDNGETITKTVPSGVAVNVPCQTGEDHGQGSGDGDGHGNADKTPEPEDTPEADATEANDDDAGEAADHTPVSLPTEANEHASEGDENGAVPLPTEANEHASERGDNGSGH